MLAIGLAGPQRVLAEVQMLFGFAPGVGFVQPGETRLLAAPVEVRQGNVTVRIDGVIANAQQTQVTFTATGLSREKFGPTMVLSLKKLSLTCWCRTGRARP